MSVLADAEDDDQQRSGRAEILAQIYADALDGSKPEDVARGDGLAEQRLTCHRGSPRPPALQQWIMVVMVVVFRIHTCLQS